MSAQIRTSGAYKGGGDVLDMMNNEMLDLDDAEDFINSPLTPVEVSIQHFPWDEQKGGHKDIARPITPYSGDDAPQNRNTLSSGSFSRHDGPTTPSGSSSVGSGGLGAPGNFSRNNTLTKRSVADPAPVAVSAGRPPQDATQERMKELEKKIERAQTENDENQLSDLLQQLAVLGEKAQKSGLLERIDIAQSAHDDEMLAKLLKELAALSPDELRQLREARGDSDGSSILPPRARRTEVGGYRMGGGGGGSDHLMGKPLVFRVPGQFAARDKIVLTIPDGYGVASNRLVEISGPKFQPHDRIEFMVPKINPEKGQMETNLPVLREAKEGNLLMRIFSGFGGSSKNDTFALPNKHDVNAEVGSKVSQKLDDANKGAVGLRESHA